jgi:4'-phosphopantetheinyl transferase
MCFSSQSIECMVARLDVSPEIMPGLTELLDDAERDRANRFVFKRDRFRYIVGRARLRQALSARLGVRPVAVELVYGKRGKPMLASRYASSDLRFNLSHSEDMAIYAFSVGREIGIDVEAVRTVPDADAIAARYFSPREYRAYLNLNLRDKAQGFFNCWTRKEAFIKALGDGFYHPLDRFDVSLAPGEPAKILRVEEASGDHCGWRIENLSPAPGFVAAVVVEDPSSCDLTRNIFPEIGFGHDRPYIYQ